MGISQFNPSYSASVILSQPLPLASILTSVFLVDDWSQSVHRQHPLTCLLRHGCQTQKGRADGIRSYNSPRPGQTCSDGCMVHKNAWREWFDCRLYCQYYNGRASGRRSSQLREAAHPRERNGAIGRQLNSCRQVFLSGASLQSGTQPSSYRLFDVSTIKEAFRRWAPVSILEQGPVKQNKHTAREDIEESIEEARYYQSLFEKM